MTSADDPVGRERKPTPSEQAIVASFSADSARPENVAHPTEPSALPSLQDSSRTASGWGGRLAWMYALVPIPLLTDWIETGAFPSNGRGWTTEVAAGMTIALLVSKIRKDHKALDVLARSDGLTGLLNRRAFEAGLEAECARAQRMHSPLCLVYIDIDRFKAVNDRLGHQMGDQVLRRLAAAITAVIRTHIDGAYRLGGDEFAVLLPSSTQEQAQRVVDRLRARLANIDPLSADFAFEFSAGVVAIGAADTASSLLHRADEAMYVAKKKGRQNAE